MALTQSRQTRDFRLAAFAVLGVLLALASVETARAASSASPLPAELAKPYVTSIQEELVLHGYDPGPGDGVPGGRTRAAIAAYQRDAGLPIDGVSSQALLNHLKFGTPKVYRPGSALARSGGLASAELVAAVQQNLDQRGYYVGSIDGIDGPATEDAVRRFQTDAMIPADGRIDDALLDRLRNADPGIRIN